MGAKMGGLDCKIWTVIVAALGSAAQHSAPSAVTARAEAAERGRDGGAVSGDQLLAALRRPSLRLK